jgi:hypothetical protein
LVSVYYIDTSASLKLLFEESHSQALADFYDANAVSPWLSSALLRIEVGRAVMRAQPMLIGQARDLLTAFHYIEIDNDLVDAAASEPDPLLRSLDAIHLASARLAGTDLAAVVTYDIRLRAAAVRAGLPVLSPGVD